MSDNLNISILVNRQSINVLDWYRSRGFSALPATPTMTGRDIKDASGMNPSYSLYLSRDGMPDHPVSDLEAFALTEGMRFQSVPPATY